MRRKRERVGQRRRHGLLPRDTSKRSLDVYFEWALMVSEGKELHQEDEKKDRQKNGAWLQSCEDTNILIWCP